MVVNYIRCGRPEETRRAFALTYPQQRVPSKSTIQRNVTKYLTYGKSHNRCSDASGWHRTARSEDNIEAVRAALEDDPDITAQRNPLPQISKSTFNRITIQNIRSHLYWLHIRHKLLDDDPDHRIRYAQWLLNKPPYFMANVFISDKANFQMNGRVSN